MPVKSHEGDRIKLGMMAKQLYISCGLPNSTDMLARLRSIVLFALYQLLIVTGILLLPVGVLVQQLGLSFPFHRAIQWCGDAHAHARAEC